MKKPNASNASTETTTPLTHEQALIADFENLIHGGVYNPRTGEVTPLPAHLIPPAAFVPICAGQTPLVFDLANAGTRSFVELVETLNQQTLELGQLPKWNLPNGWYKIGPALAEWLLRHNRPGSNREPSLGTVRYYHRQMDRGQWKPTGEALILNLEEATTNGQHRELAALLGKTSFITYIVADAPVIADAFAYIDNVKVRTSSAALKTAGLNGTAALLAGMINMAVNYAEGAYTCQKKRRTDRLSPIDVLDFVNRHPEARRAAQLTASEYKAAYEAALGHKDVIAFVVFKLLSLFGEDTTDRFMEEIEFANDNAPEHDAGEALRAFLARQRKSSDPVAKHLILAHIIKAFNAWVQGRPIKKLSVSVDDDFPEFVESAPTSEESEELQLAVATE